MDGQVFHHGFPKLDLTEPNLRFEHQSTGWHVWDGLRKKWLLLTPEEWVRQHVIHWLKTVTGFPEKLLTAERQVKNRKRADVIGYDRNGKPLLLVECKAPDIPIDSLAAQQAILYHQSLASPFLWLTNGKVHWVFQFQPIDKTWKKLAGLPSFEDMLAGI